MASVLKEATEQLEKAGVDTPKLDAQVLLCSVMNIDRINLHIYPEREISREICREFGELIKKRVNMVPIQYIINKQEFMGLDFYIEEGVLIPRGDTEILIEETLRIYKEKEHQQDVSILDIGTGSGAISVSLAKYIPKAQVYAVDISETALRVANKNAITNKVDSRVKFLEGSMFDPIDALKMEKHFDFIVSNPPYIPSEDVLGLDRQVKDYEPRLALDGGNDGLDFYRKITTKSPEFLKKNGWLLFEIGYDQGKAVKELLLKVGFVDVEVLQDLAGKDRVVRGRINK
ncbi:peptide chain release factor N(5)-glutamine methyltransferase [Serpentinicella sp. ANB-PHB4]|uniref:peptide chain release factor N(5)-glutamine methyltransferase n=1 Tax=Serpentinicella sp. ANB-PHB4 TaxID=3074076 RepID=UPI002867265F|nr:peptide chain release factor N(5)-glutamine methyltransferase [Serpentinicella sp. ANB-PHB4]MDR5659734.1 peptide chain release factor N(5)-glutamine methyltransferase [Serpentinicella sp. ANB-PHB4]